ncbi:helix-turn-helix domain-containing protein [Pseudomonas bohemica]|uniref:helix-turn-helix domain-containing protein n=1 Tax=Pseudomonas bohemica TaxID=2044872 RepID=UPI000DA5FAA3|nr:helix-turn-helix transcriptional regulator [Pseudomonas bohemica]
MTGIGPRLREERTRLKLSQSALGAVGGVETNAQGNYESGARSPKTDYLLRILGAGVDINYVLTGSRQNESGASVIRSTESEPAQAEHLDKVTHQLHRNLHGLIDALYQMTLLIELRASDTEDDAVKKELGAIRTEAQELAQASVRLIFVTSRLA